MLADGGTIGLVMACWGRHKERRKRKLRRKKREEEQESRTPSWEERFLGMAISFFFLYIFHFFYISQVSFSVISILFVGLLWFGDYWLNVWRACYILCPILTSIFDLNSMAVGPMDEVMKWVRYACKSLHVLLLVAILLFHCVFSERIWGCKVKRNWTEGDPSSLQ